MANLTIRITPQEMRDAAKFLRDTKEEIIEKVNSVSAKIDEVEQGWEGAAQSTFIDNYDSEMKPLLEKDFPEIMEGLAAQLEAAAEAIETADEEVANAFRG